MEKHKSYRRFPIDNKVSLKLLSEKTGINRENLINFHNVFASPKEYIGDEQPQKLNFLYVPPNFHYLYSGLSTNNGLNLFLYNKPSHQPKKYSIEYFQTHGDKKTRVAFTIEVVFKKTINNDYHVYEIHKLTPSIHNGEMEENDLQEINEKINTIIYPLQVITNDNGSYKEVVYPDTIKKQWEALKKEIVELYKGAYINHIVSYHDQMINDKTKFQENFAHFWLFKVLFYPFYTLYDYNEKSYEYVDFKIIDDENPPFHFKVFKDFTNIDTTGDLLKFEYKGLLEDKKSRMEIEWTTGNPSFQKYNNLPSKGIYEQSMVYNNQQKTIEAINLKIILELEKPITTHISITIIPPEEQQS